MSRSASITSWLTERSLKKALRVASLWIPLISFVTAEAIYRALKMHSAPPPLPV